MPELCWPRKALRGISNEADTFYKMPIAPIVHTCPFQLWASYCWINSCQSSCPRMLLCPSHMEDKHDRLSYQTLKRLGNTASRFQVKMAECLCGYPTAGIYDWWSCSYCKGRFRSLSILISTFSTSWILAVSYVSRKQASAVALSPCILFRELCGPFKHHGLCCPSMQWVGHGFGWKNLVLHWFLVVTLWWVKAFCAFVVDLLWHTLPQNPFENVHSVFNLRRSRTHLGLFPVLIFWRNKRTCETIKDFFNTSAV